jgi:hypothetical protein
MDLTRNKHMLFSLFLSVEGTTWDVLKREKAKFNFFLKKNEKKMENHCFYKNMHNLSVSALYHGLIGMKFT